MHSLIELAEFRQQDFLAEAARHRLAKQAQPIKPLASLDKAVLANAVQTLCASARSVLDPLSFSALDSSGKKRAQTMLTVAR